jgi:TfoX/Sxy family transcriptional regulator of competence genes
MASSLDFVEYVCGQISKAGNIAYKKMFGEYAIYCNGKVIGLICDNQFFVKKTPAGELLLQSGEEAPPYAGAKPHLVIDCLDDRELLADLISKTCDALPVPKPEMKK